MQPSLASRMEEANTALVVNGNLDTVDDFFTPDYVAHITERDLEGGPAGVRQFVRMLRGAFSGLAERLLLSRKH